MNIRVTDALLASRQFKTTKIAATAHFGDALGCHLAACDRVLRRVSAGVTS
jgi:hypothetical protein